ncbi:hypothetical protein CLIB1423_09S02454 [[Candida] railenensis]|uniref:Uncharacterized protein n=1 Tax=[Candida] railenensis TaxID=45579 RepID=A0A9P0QQK8_9ASCO|nr:hypothetical protein CLIB1423_09S02454 [[Candida] railenensis]
MEESLKSQAEARKARLAELRGQRNQSRANPTEIATREAPVSEEDHKIENASHTNGNTNINTTNASKSKIEKAPVFQISKFETVEAIASDEQAKIMAKFNQQAISAAADSASSSVGAHTNLKQERVSHNKDLKDDIQDYLDLAADKTNIALHKIIHRKFLQAQEGETGSYS